MKIDRKIFWDGFRRFYNARYGQLSQEVADGLNRLLSFIEADLNWKSVKHTAYFIATIFRETSTFRPVREKRARPGTPLRAVQDKYWHTGYFGRGYIQLTHKRNYEKASRTLNVDFVNNPDRVLDPGFAYEIAARGMREGWFTGKKLSDFISGNRVDYFNARKIVNGLDHAEEIARNASAIEATLRSAISAASDSADVAPGAGAAVEPPLPAPQINVERADEVTTAPQPIPGGMKDDPPVQASTGGTKSLWATFSGTTVLTILGAVWTWAQGNLSAVMVIVICITWLLTLYMFRQFILDFLRMKFTSDPTKINVK